MTTIACSRPALKSSLRPSDRWDRWAALITWVAIVAPLPYAVSRLLWAADVPLGIDRAELEVFRAGWGWLGILGLVALTEGTSVYTHLFLKSRPRTIPSRIPILGGRPVRRWVVVAPLLAPILILAFANAWSLGPITDGFDVPGDNAGMAGWLFWTQITGFWIWGVSLTLATIAYLDETRRRRTGPRTSAPEPAAS